MPQMAPMMWVNLMIMTLISFICFMIINYFIFLPKKKSSNLENFIPMEKTWKW
uniref:ATP synthase F0 subunit 8 n=1 Tax=Allogalathea elegans TaxID=541025 RepID=UPI0021823961|nr:ATP synthase F0 subunit 8 [Allogalathea elegans]UVF62808.1 ATP synthase F0 subunit 8 [Allogalathea elegans]